MNEGATVAVRRQIENERLTDGKLYEDARPELL
jgi:hypothetical protein